MLIAVRALVFALVLAVSSAAPAVCEILCGFSAGHVHHHDADVSDHEGHEASADATVSVAAADDRDCAHPPVALAIVDSLRSAHLGNALVEMPSMVAVIARAGEVNRAVLPVICISPHSSPPVVPLRI